MERRQLTSNIAINKTETAEKIKFCELEHQGQNTLGRSLQLPGYSFHVFVKSTILQSWKNGNQGVLLIYSSSLGAQAHILPTPNKSNRSFSWFLHERIRDQILL